MEKPESTAVRRFNRAHRDDGFTARFQTLAGYQRIPDVCDVALIDSSWLAHHVQTGLIADLTERVEKRKDDFVGAASSSPATTTATGRSRGSSTSASSTTTSSTPGRRR